MFKILCVPCFAYALISSNAMAVQSAPNLVDYFSRLTDAELQSEARNQIVIATGEGPCRLDTDSPSVDVVYNKNDDGSYSAAVFSFCKGQDFLIIYEGIDTPARIIACDDFEKKSGVSCQAAATQWSKTKKKSLEGIGYQSLVGLVSGAFLAALCISIEWIRRKLFKKKGNRR